MIKHPVLTSPSPPVVFPCILAFLGCSTDFFTTSRLKFWWARAGHTLGARGRLPGIGRLHSKMRYQPNSTICLGGTQVCPWTGGLLSVHTCGCYVRGGCLLLVESTYEYGLKPKRESRIIAPYIPRTCKRSPLLSPPQTITG